jgi:hypothetical protein
MINNFDLIKGLMNFSSDDEFYFVQILLRKKDNPETQGSNNNARLIKSYFISSVEKLEELKGEMILLADYYNARVCISLNKKSYYKSAFHMLKKVTDQILNKDYKSVRRAYNSVAGEFSTGDKIWLLDVDDKEFDSTELLQMINELQPVGDKYLATIPTKNGYHLITKPFNIQEFVKKYPEIQIHKNNPTILYIPTVGKKL